jgi:hypothetical protein
VDSDAVAPRDKFPALTEKPLHANTRRRTVPHDMEKMMTNRSNAVDPVPQDAYPSFQPMTGPAPAMSSAWTCTALLHPFSPPFSINPQPDNPFFQLCVASIAYMEGQFLSA